MAPQTRSTTKSTPRRTTRNSTSGRSSLPSPARPWKTTTKRSESTSADGPQAEGNATSVSSDPVTAGSAWFACRDSSGFPTSVALSETGEGIHVRWQYESNDDAEDEKDAAEVEMMVDEDHDIVPPPATAVGPCDAASRFPETPMPLYPYKPGSVILTPVKKARPLQPSPARIGGTRGIRRLYQQDGVLRELNSGTRIVVPHPVGSSVNMTRDQVELLEKAKQDRIALIQVAKLLADGERIRREAMMYRSESVYDDSEREPGASSQGSPESDDSEDESFSDSESDSTPSDVAMLTSPENTDCESDCFRGPHGELLDQHGRPKLGPERTLLVVSTNALPRGIMREDAFLAKSEWKKVKATSHRRRLGPCGTELID